MHLSLARTLNLATLFALTAVFLGGCNSTGDGPQRYKLSGSANYQGKPIAVGEISFTPDSSKGNDGPGSVARIKDGKYETEPDMGVVGGPYVVRITAFDGVAVGESTEGTPLLKQPHEEQVELEKKDSTKDFNLE